MSKIRCVVSSIFYPLFMGKYMISALERRDDVELFTIGPFTGDWIPWSGGMRLPMKYVQPPNLPLPKEIIGSKPSYELVKNRIPWKPDLWIQIDAGFHFSSKPESELVILIETDPHVLSNHYKFPKSYSDLTFNMQSCYLEPGDIYWPYGYASEWFYPQEKEQIHDACAIGLQYNQRNDLVNSLRAKGLDVFYDIGIVYDEYREKYNESKVALSWSSLLDLPSRVWEAFGMRNVLVTNRLPDLDRWFVEGEHYLGFDTQEEAVEKVLWALDNYDEAKKIADNGYTVVKHIHDWDARIEELLQRCKLV